MGKVLLVSRKVGTSLFALCSASVFMLSQSLLTDSDFDSVNINLSKISTGSKQNSLQIIARIVKGKKSVCKPHKEFSGDPHRCLDLT